ncbi:MAG TPA: outer membrane lipoprotein chaperone LolA [Pseudomonadales bacterium]|nr:outer membrane lipoprotein chaperone LolA [Pseudomonadales bacterium]
MKMIKPFFLSLMAVQCLLPGFVYADAMTELLAVLSPIKGISADFSQDTFNAKGVVQQHNEGVLKAQEPNRFYWKTAEPYPQEIITDGKTLWVYDPDLAQVAIKPFEENYSKTPAMLFAGNAAVISEQFTVEKVPAEKLAGGAQGFRLIPKKQQRDLFESLEMSFVKGVPVSMTILDAMQQKTVIAFSKVTVNPAVAVDGTFSFVPPAGVEVLKAPDKHN